MNSVAKFQVFENESAYLSQLDKTINPHQTSYLAMYSSWIGGIVKNPKWMMIPVDDHIVHRGDGVFEAFKVINKKAFLMNEHFDRLYTSAEKIHLKIPVSKLELFEILSATFKASGVENGLVRLYVSRGPGTFSANPHDSVGGQIYLIVTEFKAYPQAKYLSGVRIAKSQIPVKETWLAQVKSCNYLPNVMMKYESIEKGVDFTIGVDNNNFVTESSTENVVIVDKYGFLLRPRLHHILRGTTMIRSLKLAEVLVKSGQLKGVAESDLTEEALASAQEVMMIGTTLDVLPVVEYNGKKIGLGHPGPVSVGLNALLQEDIKTGPCAVELL